jgi:hypothetical protein
MTFSSNIQREFKYLETQMHTGMHSMNESVGNYRYIANILHKHGHRSTNWTYLPLPFIVTFLLPYSYPLASIRNDRIRSVNRFPTMQARVRSQLGHVGFVVDEVELGWFSPSTSVSCQFSFHHLLQIRLIIDAIDTDQNKTTRYMVLYTTYMQCVC